MKYASILVAVVVLLGIGLVTPAAADFITGTNSALISIRTSDGTGAAETRWILPNGQVISGHNEWDMPGPTTLASQGMKLGVFKNMQVVIDTDPGISLNVGVENTGPTPLTVEMILLPLTFPAISSPAAFAQATFTLQDNNGDGAQVTGLLAGGKAYEALYNSTSSTTPDGVSWVQLVGSFSAPAYDSATSGARQPSIAPNREIIPATVFSIQPHYKFLLSPNDSVSLTSRFDVAEPVPEPSTFVLLAAGLLVRAWRWQKAGK
jgi:hypothetical protein